ADTIDNDTCIKDHSDKRQVALKSLIGHDSNSVQNPFQANVHRRQTKRIKSSMENNTTKNKVVNIKSHSGDTYTCHNCSNHGYN
ncbi:31808_t:CDS:2, partial [Gigaspora margarita]